MEIDEYYSNLDKLSTRFSKMNESAHDFLEDFITSDLGFIQRLIEFRRGFVGSKELDQVRPYLSIGLFNQFHGLDRECCFVICFELDEIATKRSWRMRCERYRSDHPLFARIPELMEHIYDGELIKNNACPQINDSEVLQIGTRFGRLDASLNPMIVSWAQATFPNSKIWVRANPFEVFDIQPKRRLFESIMMPANPNWWRNLEIYNRTKTGGAYQLDECSPDENPQKYWELHVKRVSRLEVIAKRNNAGNLSMMLEELNQIDGHGLLFGRCIHLDTDSKFGTPFFEAALNHLDLAINIYENESATKRSADNLAQGNVTTDASYRTHLLRIEGVPFKSLLGFVCCFFRSQTLINEWFSDQFQQPEVSEMDDAKSN